MILAIIAVVGVGTSGWAGDLILDGNLTVASNLTVQGNVTGINAADITNGVLPASVLPTNGTWNAQGIVITNAQFSTVPAHNQDVDTIDNLGSAARLNSNEFQMAGTCLTNAVAVSNTLGYVTNLSGVVRIGTGISALVGGFVSTNNATYTQAIANASTALQPNSLASNLLFRVGDGILLDTNAIIITDYDAANGCSGTYLWENPKRYINTNNYFYITNDTQLGVWQIRKWQSTGGEWAYSTYDKFPFTWIHYNTAQYDPAGTYRKIPLFSTNTISSILTYSPNLGVSISTNIFQYQDTNVLTVWGATNVLFNTNWTWGAGAYNLPPPGGASIFWSSSQYRWEMGMNSFWSPNLLVWFPDLETWPCPGGSFRIAYGTNYVTNTVAQIADLAKGAIQSSGGVVSNLTVQGSLRGVSASQVGAISTSGVTSLIYSNASAFAPASEPLAFLLDGSRTGGRSAWGNGVNITNIDSSAWGASQNGYISGPSGSIGSGSYGAQQRGRATANGRLTIGSAAIGSYQFVTIGTAITGTIENLSYGSGQIGYMLGNSRIASKTYGALQRGQFANAYIGTNASAATQIQSSPSTSYGSMTNLAMSAVQIACITNGQVSYTTTNGAASLMLGAGYSSNKNAIVVGDGQATHGDGSITAGGGFYGNGAGITGISALQVGAASAAQGAKADSALQINSLATSLGVRLQPTGINTNILIVSNAGTAICNGKYYYLPADEYYQSENENEFIYYTGVSWALWDNFSSSDIYSSGSLTGQWTTIGSSGLPQCPVVNYGLTYTTNTLGELVEQFDHLNAITNGSSSVTLTGNFFGNGSNLTGITPTLPAGILINNSTNAWTLALGESAYAYGSALAVGPGSTASVSSATAVGVLANATEWGTAVGRSATALSQGVSLGQQASSKLEGVAVGSAARADQYAVAVGSVAVAHDQATAIGAYSEATYQSTAIGMGAGSGTNGIAIGSTAYAKAGEIVIGSTVTTGGAIPYTSHGSGTMSIGASDIYAGTQKVVLENNTRFLAALTNNHAGAVTLSSNLEVKGALSSLKGVTGTGLLNQRYNGLQNTAAAFQVNANDQYGIAYCAAGDNYFSMWQEYFKTRSVDGNTHAIVHDKDEILVFNAFADDGMNWAGGQAISLAVEGIPAVGKIPTRMDLWTTGTDQGAPCQRISINSKGYVGINVYNPDVRLSVEGGLKVTENVCIGSNLTVNGTIFGSGSNITGITAAQVGAASSIHTHTADQVGALPNTVDVITNQHAADVTLVSNLTVGGTITCSNLTLQGAVNVQVITLNGQAVTNWSQVGGGALTGIIVNGQSSVMENGVGTINLGLNNAAYSNASDFASGAQGARADSAVQTNHTGDVRINGNVTVFSYSSMDGSMPQMSVVTNTGIVWQDLPVTATWGTMGMSDNGRVMVASVSASGAYGPLMVSTNFGTAWYPVACSNVWYDFDASADGRIIVAAVRGGKLWRSTDYGSTWGAIDTTPVLSWESVAMSSDGKFIVAGNYGSDLWMSSDSGATWHTNSSIPASKWLGVDVSSDGKYQVIASRQHAMMMMSTNFGEAWYPLTAAPYIDWRSVSISDNGKYLIGAAFWYVGGAHYSTNGGVNWIQVSGPQAGETTTISGDGRYMAYAHSSATHFFWNSFDFGQTWSQRSNEYGVWQPCISKDGAFATVLTADKIKASLGYSDVWGNTLFRIQKNGNVGIGTISPQDKLHVVGNVRVDGLITGDGTGLTNIPIAGVVGAVSSAEVSGIIQSVVSNIANISVSQVVGAVSSDTVTNIIQSVVAASLQYIPQQGDLSMGAFTNGPTQ